MRLLTTLTIILFSISAYSQQGQSISKIIFQNSKILVVEDATGTTDTIDATDIVGYFLESNKKTIALSNGEKIIVAYDGVKQKTESNKTDDFRYVVTPGDHLIKAKTFMGVGIGITILSGGIFGASALSENSETQKIVMGIGGGVGLAGLAIFFKGIFHIGKAGDEFNRLDIGGSATLDIGIQDHGLGLKFRL